MEFHCNAWLAKDFYSKNSFGDLLTIGFVRGAGPEPPSWPITSGEDQYRQKSRRDYFEPSAWQQHLETPAKKKQEEKRSLASHSLPRSLSQRMAEPLSRYRCEIPIFKRKVHVACATIFNLDARVNATRKWLFSQTFVITDDKGICREKERGNRSHIPDTLHIMILHFRVTVRSVVGRGEKKTVTTRCDDQRRFIYIKYIRASSWNPV